MFLCYIKYTIDLNKLEEFRSYANTWIVLIEKYGGNHRGYFLPNNDLNNALNHSFSFPGLGTSGANNVAIALFDFKDIDAYEEYRKNVKDDPLCIQATELMLTSKCVINYERTFLTPLSTIVI